MVPSRNIFLPRAIFVTRVSTYYHYYYYYYYYYCYCYCYYYYY